MGLEGARLGPFGFWALADGRGRTRTAPRCGPRPWTVRSAMISRRRRLCRYREGGHGGSGAAGWGD